MIRPGAVPTDIATIRQHIRNALAADDARPDEVVEILFVGETDLDEVFAAQTPSPASLGWEALILPGSLSSPRRIRLPESVQTTVGIRGADPERLQSLHRWAQRDYADPLVDHDESLLIHLEGQVMGWVPVWRLAPRTSLVRHTLIDASAYADELSRRTLLRLGTYASAVEHQLDQGRTVISWLPDDNDDVNSFKLQVSAPVHLTHWVGLRARRDLRPISEPAA